MSATTMGSRRGEDVSSLSGGAANNSLSDKALESLILADILTGTKFWSPLAYYGFRMLCTPGFCELYVALQSFWGLTAGLPDLAYLYDLFVRM